MKILQVTALYYPHVGGIENYVYQISRRLVEKGHEVTIFTSNIPMTNSYEEIEGIKIYRFNSIFSLLSNHVLCRMFIELIKKHDFDIIHAHGYLQFATNFAVISKLKNKVPLIITSHGSPQHQYNGWKKCVSILYHKSLGKWTLSLADTVIALSFSQCKLLKQYGAKHVQIIPNGISMDNIKPEQNCSEFKRKFQLDSELIVLYVGSITPRKGIEYLIESMKFVRYKSKLVIVGDVLYGKYEYKNKLLNLIENLEIDNVVFTGRISEELLREAYIASDIFVLPSLAEGLPTVLLEAMQHKKAIIASDISGNNDLIQNNYNGILVNVKSSMEIANAINSLMTNPEKIKQLGFRAYNTVKEDYLWENITNNIENVYKKNLKRTSEELVIPRTYAVELRNQ